MGGRKSGRQGEGLSTLCARDLPPGYWGVPEGQRGAWAVVVVERLSVVIWGMHKRLGSRK